MTPRQFAIRWGSVLLSAALIEVTMIALWIPVRQYGQNAVTTAVVVASFVLPLLSAIWVSSRAQAHFVLHGALIGAVAILIYLTMAEAGRRFGPPQGPQPFAYTVAHALKLLGGALGGAVASWRARVKNTACKLE